ncbi:MAG TPA: pitrilysin family protein [Allosphingosinicella sp.]
MSMRPALLPYALISALALCAPAVLASAAAAPGPASASAPEPAPLPQLVRKVDIPYQSFTLDNGLRVVVHEDRKTPVVAVSVWYGVGSSDEPRGKTGFAHLFEHLMFNGSGNYDGEFFEPLEDVGATNSNGTTNVDRTNYFENVPTPALDMALFLEADRMGNLLPAVTQLKLDNQRGVVQNEKRQGDNQPYGLVRYGIFEGLFPEGHPYRHSTIGSMADLDAAAMADVQQWFRTHYGPNNSVLVLAGDINAAEARPLVEKYFGAIPRGPATPEPAGGVPDRSATTRQTINDRVANPRLYFLWAVPGQIQAASAHVDIATSILAGGQSSRLYNALVREEQLATAVGGGINPLQLASIPIITVDVKPGVDPARVEARAAEIIAKFVAEGPTPDEVQRIATRYVSGTIRGLEQIGGFGGKAVALAQGTLYANDPAFYRKRLGFYANATPAAVKAAAQRWLNDGDHRLWVVPGERGAAELALAGQASPRPAPPPVAASEPDRSKLPRVGPSPDIDFPTVEHATLSNGIKVTFARRAAVPVVDIMASFDAGNAADPRDKLGAQFLTFDLLDEGTARRTGPQIIEEIERLGAFIGSSGGMDSTRVQLSALTPNLAPSLDLFADVLRNPAFAPDQVERVRAIQLSRIAQEESSPGGLAQRRLSPLLYGDSHPYAVPVSGLGNADTVRSLTREDLVAFHRTWLRPDNMRLFVVGDTNLAQLMPQLERAFGDWRPLAGVPKGVKAFTAAAPKGGPRIILIDRPNSPQSFIAAGMPLDVRGTDDKLDLSMANDVLGGSFTSRLNMDLREAKGWSYGVGSQLRLVREQMPFVLTAPVQADRTGDSIAALRDDIKAYLGDKPITQAELARMTNGNVLSLPGEFETGSSVLAALERSYLMGRPDDYYERLPARYRALDTAGVHRAVAAALDPARLVWVVVGDAKVVQPQLTQLGLPVEVVPAAR